MGRIMYIVFEGLLGTGKTTQSKRLAEELKSRFPNRTILWSREPGGSEISESIRTLAQGTQFTEEMDPICEAYLFAAARAQSLRTAIRPVLDQNGIVIADRSFASSVAWQGFGRGLGLEKILEINQVAIENHLPDVIIELDLDPETALKRTFDAKGDKFETLPLDFHERCREGYRALSEHPLMKARWQRIDATGTADEVYEKIKQKIAL
jgi:dTMP kinase